MKVKLTGMIVTMTDKGWQIAAQYARDDAGTVENRIARLTLNDEASFALAMLTQNVVDALVATESKVESVP